jgi:protease-4
MLRFPFRYLWWLVSRVRARIGRPPDYVIFTIEADLPALPDPPVPLWQRFLAQPRLSLRELGERFDTIARDRRVKGIVLHLRPVPMPMATLQDMRELVSRLRGAGKRVVAWAPFYTTGTYYLACACDEILLLPGGQVRPLGFSTTGVYLAHGLARFGIQADFVQVSPYKSAADPLTKSKMSAESREQLTWLLESHHRDLITAVRDSRGLDESAARELIDRSPFDDDQARERRVVDGVMPEEQLPSHLGGAGAPGAPVTLGAWEQARPRLARPAPSLGRGPYVAILRIEGTILDGRSGRPPVKPPVEVPIVGGDRAGDLTVVALARAVAADRRAAAAVLYVNSGGGSATASEAMRQALSVLAAAKPLVAAMGPVAASGGYWVATPARWIVARPGTITGSMGVLAGKVFTGGLGSKLLFNRETVALGKHVDIEGDDRLYSAEERQIVESSIQRIYGMFRDLVGSSRGLKPEEVEPLAGGRVWTGSQALDRRLVDELGGLDAAVRKARALAGLGDAVPSREVFPPRRSLPPRPLPSAAAYAGYLLEGVSLVNRTPALAVMELLGDVAAAGS